MANVASEKSSSSGSFNRTTMPAHYADPALTDGVEAVQGVAPTLEMTAPTIASSFKLATITRQPPAQFKQDAAADDIVADGQSASTDSHVPPNSMLMSCCLYCQAHHMMSPHHPPPSELSDLLAPPNSMLQFCCFLSQAGGQVLPCQPAPQLHDAIHSNARLDASLSSLLPEFSQEDGPHQRVSLFRSLQVMLVIALLPVSTQILLQTNWFPMASKLVAAELFCLLVSLMASFIFLVLLVKETYSKDRHATWATRACCCLVVFAIVTAIALRVMVGLATSSPNTVAEPGE